MLELSGVNLTPHMGQRMEAFCSTNINKELIQSQIRQARLLKPIIQLLYNRMKICSDCLLAQQYILIMQTFQNLQERIQSFQQYLQKQKEERELKVIKKKEELQELQESYQQRNNSIISKIEELKRKETLLITIKRIQPEIPEGFPKNYFCQLVYEDTVLTGTQKFTDFDQNVIEEKFVLPLLFSSMVKVEVWTAEEDPTLWARTQINLQKDIQTALISEACQGQLYLSEGDVSLTYRLQLQGIGFSTWLRNIIEIRQLQAEKAYLREQGQVRKEQMKVKVQEKKQKFDSKFSKKKEATTSQFSTATVQQLLKELQVD